jgi:DNA polymerase-3 subunit gamma/tau
MPSSRLSALAAGLLALSSAAPLRAAAQNAVEAGVAPVPTNLVSGAGAVVAAPVPSLSAAPGLLAAPSIVASAPLAPALSAPLPLAAPALMPAPAAAPQAAPARVEAAPAAPLAALKDAGLKIDAGARARDAAAAPAALDALFERPGIKRADAPAVAGGESLQSSAHLDAAAPRAAGAGRRMPAGVRAVFQKSAVMGGGMAALFAALWTQVHQIAPNATFAQFAALALPLALIPLHFALVSGFWAGRYYLYPRLSDSGKTAFRGAWSAAAAVYPPAALLALGAWGYLLAHQPTVLALSSPVALLAAAEVVHHFVYRVSSERRQDDGKPLLDWRSRAWGNVGQQLRRMRRRG